MNNAARRRKSALAVAIFVASWTMSLSAYADDRPAGKTAVPADLTPSELIAKLNAAGVKVAKGDSIIGNGDVAFWVHFEGQQFSAFRYSSARCAKNASEVFKDGLHAGRWAFEKVPTRLRSQIQATIGPEERAPETGYDSFGPQALVKAMEARGARVVMGTWIAASMRGAEVAFWLKVNATEVSVYRFPNAQRSRDVADTFSKGFARDEWAFEGVDSSSDVGRLIGDVLLDAH